MHWRSIILSKTRPRDIYSTPRKCWGAVSMLPLYAGPMPIISHPRLPFCIYNPQSTKIMAGTPGSWPAGSPRSNAALVRQLIAAPVRQSRHVTTGALEKPLDNCWCWVLSTRPSSLDCSRCYGLCSWFAVPLKWLVIFYCLLVIDIFDYSFQCIPIISGGIPLHPIKWLIYDPYYYMPIV